MENKQPPICLTKALYYRKEKQVFVLHFRSLNRTFDFVEGTFARQNKLKQVLFAFSLT